MDLIALLGAGVCFVAIFLSLFFVFQKNFKNDGYLFLYGCLLVLAFELFYKVLIHSKVILEVPLLYVPGRLNNLMVYPLFLFFILSIALPKFKWGQWHRFLLLVFGMYGAYVMVKAALLPMETKLEMLSLFYQDRRPGPFDYWRNPVSLLKSTIIPMLFLGVIGYHFFRFKKEARDRPSKRLMYLLSTIIILYAAFNQLANVVYRSVHRITGYSMVEWPVDILFLSLLLLLFSVVALLVNTGSPLFPTAKYSKSTLSSAAYKDIVESAQRVMEQEELFKKDSVTLTELSTLLGTNPKYLSQSINVILGCNFTDFVNAYRVEEAKRQMLDLANHALTLEAIGMKAGFKSKSVFYGAFKKTTGFTPSQFLKRQKSSDS